MSSPARGLLIVVEGLDRSGKSTQCSMLSEALVASGHKVKAMRFPDRSTSIGSSIDAYLRSATDLEDHVVHLLFAANRWEAVEGMQRALADGITLLIDRYSFSGAVYSAAKGNAALSLDWAWQAEAGLPRPDVVFYLTVSEQMAEQRGGFGAERYEKRDMQRRVAVLFEELLTRRLGLTAPTLNVVDANRSVEAVHRDLLGVATKALRDTAGLALPVQVFGALQPPLEEH